MVNFGYLVSALVETYLLLFLQLFRDSETFAKSSRLEQNSPIYNHDSYIYCKYVTSPSEQ